jgi:ATPase subunit of ABC transporter with duplicated ATPase domains
LFSTRKEIDDLQYDLKDLDMAILEKDGVIYQWLSENYKPTLDSWVEKLSKMNSLKKQINAALKAKQWNDEIKAEQIETKVIPTINKSIDGNIEQLNANNTIRLYSGEELSLKDVNLVTHKYLYKLILIIGDTDSGKTTLLATLYDLFQIAPFKDYLFAGSLTQIGFETRCHDKFINIHYDQQI